MQQQKNWLTKSVAVVAVLGLFIFAVFASKGVPQPEVTLGDTAPRFTAQTTRGTVINFPSRSRGNPTIVVMWSTWCPYCNVLMPRLERIRSEFEVDVIAINAKERGMGDPVRYIDEAGFDFVSIIDGDAIASLYDVKYLPGLFVVGPTGKIVFRRGWTDLDPGQQVADLWEAQIREAVKVASTTAP